jgi:hypothetical protein
LLHALSMRLLCSRCRVVVCRVCCVIAAACEARRHGAGGRLCESRR